MKSSFPLAVVLAACLLSLPAMASDSELPMHADRFVRALQEQRFDDAAAMFTSAPDGMSTTAKDLQRIAARIGGLATMRNILSMPEGRSLKLELPSSGPLASKPDKYYQMKYAATAADGRPVFYVLNLDAVPAQARILSFEVHFPVADARSAQRAGRIVDDITR